VVAIKRHTILAAQPKNLDRQQIREPVTV